MKNSRQLMIASLALVLICSGCSMGKKPAASPTPSMTPTPTDSASPSPTAASTASIQDLLNYMQTNNYTFTNVTPIDNMDFNALEGTSFQYNDQLYYLYRFDPVNAESMKMLEYARQNGRMKVNVNGQDTEYHAYVNGNTALIYDSSDPITDLKDIYNRFDFSALQGE